MNRDTAAAVYVTQGLFVQCVRLIQRGQLKARDDITVQETAARYVVAGDAWTETPGRMPSTTINVGKG